MDIGINLSPAAYFSTQFPWVNYFKQAQQWRTQNNVWVPGGQNAWDTGVSEAIPKDANGYPLSLPFPVTGTEAPQVVSSLLFREIEGKYPAGEYVCRYDGAGKLQFSFDASLISEEPGEVRLQVQPSDNGIKVDILESAAGNHVRNIRFFREGSEEGTFQQQFLDFCEPFSWFRFMDWQRINGIDETKGSPVYSPHQYYGPDRYTQAGEFGISPYYIVDLCNAANKHPWICLHHLGSNSYVLAFAKYVKKHLNPNLQVRFELSNEVWNKKFQQARDAAKYGLALKLAPDEFTAQMRMYALRASEVSKIIKSVFADEPDRVKFVLAGQAANSYSLSTALEFQDTAEWVDELAIGPYFGISLGSPASVWDTIGLTPQEIIAACHDNIEHEVSAWITSGKEVADQYEMPLIAYEGGQHLVGFDGVENNQAITDLFIAANELPEMGDVYTHYLQTWQELGGGHMNLFRSMDQPSKWGSWGLVTHQSTPWSTQSKYQAVLKAL